MTLQTEYKTAHKSKAELFTFLTQVENYKQIMPESMEQFETLSKESFLFQLKGMPQLKLEIKETHPDDKIVLGALSDKLPFTLTLDLNEKAQGQTDAQLTFEGQFNAMMSMMIKKPITNFIETLAENISKL
ncbi:hypothetical protein GCM10009117_23030 [Gangjinia marincola]|uniref:SRPBCC family protein n=1 Tax=Gangjinia marincola TaxID=578463 RepID=A0ABP3XYT1_9FLAO